jgi:hypothetical protein
MKTTVEIPDDLLREAKAVAAADQVTLRSLIEEGLRQVLSRRRKKDRFVLRDASVSGRGTREGLDEGHWEQILDLVYRGRGS